MKSTGETKEIDLVNGTKDLGNRALNDLVL